MRDSKTQVIPAPNIVPSMRGTYNAIRAGLDNPVMAQHTRVLCVRGRRSAKTHTICNAHIPTFFSKPSYFGYAAKDDKATRGGWREIVRFCSDMRESIGGTWRFAPSEEGVIQAPNGSIWDKVSLWDADAGRGSTYHSLHIDELQGVREDVVANITPTLMTTQGMLIMSGTSPKNFREWRESQWWIEKIKADPAERLEKWPEWYVEYAPTTADDIAWVIRETDKLSGRRPSDWDLYLRIAHKELSKLKSQIGSARYAREVEVRLEAPDSGRVIPQFKEHHVLDSMPDRTDGTTILAYDRAGGVAMNVALAAQAYRENGVTKYIVFGEYASKALVSAPTLVREGLKLANRPVYDLIAYPDPRAADIRFELSSIGLEEFSGSVPIQDGIELLNTLFEQGRIHVCSSCPTLIRQLQSYETDKDGMPSDVDQDTVDALRYMIYNDQKQNGELWQEGEEAYISETGTLQLAGVGILQF